MGGGSAQAAEHVSAAKAQARSCHERYLGATKSTDITRTTAASTGLVRARLAGRGDWDVAVFDARTHRTVAGSAGFGARELAEGFVRKGQRLLVQACRYRGGAKGAELGVSYLGIDGGAKAATAGGKIQVVDVATHDQAEKRRLQDLGLDLTEHGDADSVEVVLHGDADEQKLRDAGFSWEVRIADLVARSKANRAADRRFAADVEQTALPSGSTSYRRLADYELQMKELAARYPSMVKPVTLAETTLEGRPVNGIEITRNADDIQDGKPTFLMMGVHHAREWPSSEHAIEFAYDLLTNYGKSARTTRLVNATRTIVVPIVNVDGFNLSREAPDDSGAGFAYKRKNCRVTDGQPPAPGACGLQVNRNRGVDPNRNYGGLWGGQGASVNPLSDTYRGAGPFSEPETRNIQKLVSGRQVTNLITNHTYGNLTLRPPGLVAQGPPIDEPAYRALGERLTDHNLYANMPSYGLYDTSGTTEDWSYYATGGWGFTFEIGPDEFHPPYEQGVVDEYLGRGDVAGAGKGGNREAYYEMLESTADAGMHSLLTGKAPKGSTITLRKQFQT
ncbi:MAG TPA: M14 family metallopeptidase, partial [Solirubrobacteraceae bacterium]|nr:M14 family metallopeptidase [Solirubrobacteraceae bacterium]